MEDSDGNFVSIGVSSVERDRLVDGLVVDRLTYGIIDTAMREVWYLA